MKKKIKNLEDIDKLEVNGKLSEEYASYFKSIYSELFKDDSLKNFLDDSHIFDILLGIKDMAKYRGALATVKQDDKYSIEEIKNKVEAIYEQGKSDNDSKKYREAIKIAKDVLQTDPINASMLYFKGKCHYRLKEYDYALECFYKIIERNLNYRLAHVYFNIGRVFEDQNNIDKAIEKYNEAVKTLPSYERPKRRLKNLKKNKKAYMND